MPRLMPRYDRVLARDFGVAATLVTTLENARVAGTSVNGIKITQRDIEFAYETAYLRMFTVWEDFLENSLIRFLCGYRHSAGQEQLKAGTYYPTIADSRAAILGKNQYLLWHNPTRVIALAQKFLAPGRFDTVLLSAQSQLEHFAAIRHRIAHAQEHARVQFDGASMSLAGRRYPGSRPGRFLRDIVPSSMPPMRRIDDLGASLVSLAEQICK
jgi:hypothetical protein